jgi:hypothetical protein
MSKNTPVDSLQKFRMMLNNSLAKLSDASTIKTGIEEIKQIMRVQIINADRMNLFITAITEFNPSTKLLQKKESFKLFGVAGEIFQETINPFVPKILTIATKKLENTHLHEAISDAIGVMCHYAIKSKELVSQQVECLIQILEPIFKSLSTLKKSQQIGMGMTITRVIQNLVTECMIQAMDYICEKLMENLKNVACKCQTQMLECVIFIVLEIGAKFQPYVENFLPCIITCMDSAEWQVRKMAVDTIFTFANFIPDKVVPYSNELLELLKNIKIDKVKHVREAALEAIKKIKSICDGTDDSKINKVKSNSPEKQSKPLYKREVNQDFFKAAVKDNELKGFVDDVNIKQKMPGIEGKAHKEYQSKLSSNEENKMSNEPSEKQSEDPNDNEQINTETSKPKQKDIDSNEENNQEVKEPSEEQNEEVEDPEEEDKSKDAQQETANIIMPKVQNYVKQGKEANIVYQKQEEEVSSRNDASKPVESSYVNNELINKYSQLVEELKEELNRITEQQVKLMETVNSFQLHNKNENASIKDRLDRIESMLEIKPKLYSHKEKAISIPKPKAVEKPEAAPVVSFNKAASFANVIILYRKES